MITIFNGRRRTVGAAANSVYAQVDVSLRENLHLFNNGKNLNSLAVFLALALHANEQGFAWPSFDLLMKETGIARKETLRAALQQLLEVWIDGSPVIRIYVREENRQHKGYMYHIFPHAGGEAPKELTGRLIVWHPSEDYGGDVLNDEQGGGTNHPSQGGTNEPSQGGTDYPSQGGTNHPSPKYNHVTRTKEQEPKEETYIGANAPKQDFTLELWIPNEEAAGPSEHEYVDDPFDDPQAQGKRPKWMHPDPKDLLVRRAMEACGGRQYFKTRKERDTWVALKNNKTVPVEWIENCISYAGKVQPMSFHNLLVWMSNRDKMTDWIQNFHRKRGG